MMGPVENYIQRTAIVYWYSSKQLKNNKTKMQMVDIFFLKLLLFSNKTCFILLLTMYIAYFLCISCLQDFRFLSRCMQCRRGLAMRILSVRLSVCLSHACIVTKR